MTTLLEPPPTSGGAPSTRSRLNLAALGRERVALIALLAATGLLYLWGLGNSGWANSFYSAAAQAGSESWKAFFFGSSDAANSITVDKTPLSLWPMAISIRLFGLSSWSILVPQALIGVGSVALLYATVKRATGNGWAGLGAGLALATTPVAALMFRFNNPDALLVLLLIASVYATLRAIEEPKRAIGWLVLAGTFVGLAFLTKMLQAFLVLPALAAGYAICAQVRPVKRLLHLLVAFGSMLVAGGWWVAIVELWPADSRPYIGGSQNNSILELTLGYNGLGRLNGTQVGSVGGGGGWGTPGLGRLFNSEIGGQIAWLLPAALVLLVAGLWFGRKRGRTDLAIASLVIWGGWLIVTAATFSFMAGIFHAYYTVALAPAIAAIIGVGGWLLWRSRDNQLAGLTAGLVIALTAAMSFLLLARNADFLPGLRWAVVTVGVAAAVLIPLWSLLPRRAAVAVALAGLITALAGPTTFAVATAQSAHTGSIPSAGPSASSFGQGGPGRGQAAAAGGGAAGGLLTGSQSTSAINELLAQDAEAFTWAGAAVGSNSAAGFQLATGLPVMAIGGFNGSDPSPTLAQFKDYVAKGQIHWFIGGGSQGGRGGSLSAGGSTSSEISQWVTQNFTAQTVDGVTIYDLSTGVDR